MGLMSRSSILEVLKLDGLNIVQKMDVGEKILDVAIYEDTMYVCLDSHGKAWVLEYQYLTDGFNRVSTNRWDTPGANRGENKVELYWLESMRKRVGVPEED